MSNEFRVNRAEMNRLNNAIAAEEQNINSIFQRMGQIYFTAHRDDPEESQAENIRGDMRAHYAAGMIDAVYMDGDFYGLPLELTNWCIFVNKQVFRDAGLDPEKDYPKTWEEMVEVSKKIVLRDGDIITRRGFDFRYSYSLIYFVPMVEQLGGALSETEGCVNEEAWVKALTFMKNWGPSGDSPNVSVVVAVTSVPTC